VRTDRLVKEYDVEIKWLAFPLHPDTPEAGLTLEELFAGRDFDVSAIRERLQRVAASLGLPLADRAKIYNSRLAQELAKWAESEMKGDEFHRAVFRAYFVDGKNIAVVDELTGLAESVGLPAGEARQAALSRRYRNAVDADWKRSRTLGLNAVPTFLFGNRKIVGFPAYEDLAELVGKGRRRQ
jgi:predicted DsbA family dithiol-disulfide isomerase